MDIICTNDSYPADELAYFKKHGVTHPVKDVLYTLRSYSRHSSGDIGIRVEEIVNPEVLVKHAVLGLIKIEPTFNVKRFATLMGDKLTKEMLNEIKQTT